MTSDDCSIFAYDEIVLTSSRSIIIFTLFQSMILVAPQAFITITEGENLSITSLTSFHRIVSPAMYNALLFSD